MKNQLPKNQNKNLYSTLVIKAVDTPADDTKPITITGIASTPTPDRADDIVESKGAQFSLPMPLLWQHDHTNPIGLVQSAKVTDAGIEIKAEVMRITKRATAYAEMIKAGLVRGLSIGFRPIELSEMKNGGLRFIKWDWYELSLVTIPANAEATISVVKSIDQVNQRAITLDGDDVDDLDFSAPLADRPNLAKAQKILNSWSE